MERTGGEIPERSMGAGGTAQGVAAVEDARRRRRRSCNTSEEADQRAGWLIGEIWKRIDSAGSCNCVRQSPRVGTGCRRHHGREPER